VLEQENAGVVWWFLWAAAAELFCSLDDATRI